MKDRAGFHRRRPPDGQTKRPVVQGFDVFDFLAAVADRTARFALGLEIAEAIVGD